MSCKSYESKTLKRKRKVETKIKGHLQIKLIWLILEITSKDVALIKKYNNFYHCTSKVTSCYLTSQRVIDRSILLIAIVLIKFISDKLKQIFFYLHICAAANSMKGNMEKILLHTVQLLNIFSNLSHSY